MTPNAEKGGRYRWQRLADYNAECARGLVHTEAYDALMTEEQRLFDLAPNGRCMSSPDGRHHFEADGRCHYCPARQ